MKLRLAFFFLFLGLIVQSSFTQEQSKEPLKHNPWSLIIYRPENQGDMNIVRCWVSLKDAESGEDVTYTKATAKYKFIADNRSRPELDTTSLSRSFRSTGRQLYNYKKKYYLSGGMAMHLNLKPGKYIISVRTPKADGIYVKTENKGDWLSNEFYYDTENPANVIFLYPTTNDNGFYNGGWVIRANTL